jgi:hypothetical protein
MSWDWVLPVAGAVAFVFLLLVVLPRLGVGG